VCSYFAALVFIIAGGAYTVRTSLATVPMPDFLIPEYLTKTSVARDSTANETRVQIKPYNQIRSAGTSWRPSLVQAYGGKSAAKNEPLHVKAANRGSKKAKRESRTRRSEAMDAYASGRRHHR
jgi:hypothetical protein